MRAVLLPLEPVGARAGAVQRLAPEGVERHAPVLEPPVGPDVAEPRALVGVVGDAGVRELAHLVLDATGQVGGDGHDREGGEPGDGEAEQHVPALPPRHVDRVEPAVREQAERAQRHRRQRGARDHAATSCAWPGKPA